MKRWLKKKFVRWLEIDQIDATAAAGYALSTRTNERLDSLISGAADVRFKGNTQLVVLTRLKGGTVQFYDFEAKDLHEIHMRALDIMGAAWPDAVIDAPHGLNATFKQMYGPNSPASAQLKAIRRRKKGW